MYPKVVLMAKKKQIILGGLASLAPGLDMVHLVAIATAWIELAQAS